MIRFQNHQYSVSPNYIGKEVEIKPDTGWPTMWTDAPTANLKRSSGTDLRYCTRALRSFTRNVLKWSFTSSAISVRNAWKHGVHGLTLSNKGTHFRISWSEASCTLTKPLNWSQESQDCLRISALMNSVPWTAPCHLSAATLKEVMTSWLFLKTDWRRQSGIISWTAARTGKELRGNP